MEKKNILVFSIVGLAIIIVVVLLFVVNPFSADPPAQKQTVTSEQTQPPAQTPTGENQESQTDQTQTAGSQDQTEAGKTDSSHDGDTYIVKEGETLKSIAQDVYGDEKKWFQIFIANEGTIDWYDTIYVGQKLMLPK